MLLRFLFNYLSLASAPSIIIATPITNSPSTSLSAMFIFGARNFNSRRIWHEKPAPKTGARKWSRFVVPVSGACVVGIQEPCYRREDRAMPLYISIRIEFYNGIARFLCHSTVFLYRPSSTSATVQMLKLYTHLKNAPTTFNFITALCLASRGKNYVFSGSIGTYVFGGAIYNS